jgi:hypothetical protein
MCAKVVRLLLSRKIVYEIPNNGMHSDPKTLVAFGPGDTYVICVDSNDEENRGCPPDP